jgi:hypothetical protein
MVEIVQVEPDRLTGHACLCVARSTDVKHRRVALQDYISQRILTEIISQLHVVCLGCFFLSLAIFRMAAQAYDAARRSSWVLACEFAAIANHVLADIDIDIVTDTKSVSSQSVISRTSLPARSASAHLTLLLCCARCPCPPRHPPLSRCTPGPARFS